MRLDKYGDEIVTTKNELDAKSKKAFLIVTLLQFLLITINILVLVIDSLNFYISFVTAPLYIFLFIHFINAYNQNKDIGNLPRYIKVSKILSPILYCVTAVLVIFTGF